MAPLVVIYDFQKRKKMAPKTEHVFDNFYLLIPRYMFTMMIVFTFELFTVLKWDFSNVDSFETIPILSSTLFKTLPRGSLY